MWCLGVLAGSSLLAQEARPADAPDRRGREALETTLATRTVRGTAVQALLALGRAAQEYLNDRRASADPELQRAIDRIWQQILAEDR